LVCLVQHLLIDVLTVGLLMSNTLVFIRLWDGSLSLISVVTVTVHLIINVISCLIDLPAMLLLVLLTSFALLLSQLGGSLAEIVLNPGQLTGLVLQLQINN